MFVFSTEQGQDCYAASEVVWLDVVVRERVKLLLAVAGGWNSGCQFVSQNNWKCICGEWQHLHESEIVRKMIAQNVTQRMRETTSSGECGIWVFGRERVVELFTLLPSEEFHFFLIQPKLSVDDKAKVKNVIRDWTQVHFS